MLRQTKGLKGSNEKKKVKRNTFTEITHIDINIKELDGQKMVENTQGLKGRKFGFLIRGHIKHAYKSKFLHLLQSKITMLLG